MSTRRISIADIIVGEPLQWDVYGNDGNLLLRKGYIVGHANQVEALIERGMFVNSDSKDRRDGKPAERVVENPSVLRILNSVRNDLHRVLCNLHNEENAPEQLISLAKQVIVGVSIDSDVALGSILLNQEGNYVTRHCVDTAVVALLIARSLKKPPEELLTLTAVALTMNVGMQRQQERLQNKSEELSEDEKESIRSHPEVGAKLLREAGVTNEDWLKWVTHHHENEDGTGYPSGLKGSEIPSNAKIISLADRYCARVCARSYRKSMLPNAALRDILIQSKGTIDPMLVTVFIRELGTYPIGTFVKLVNGEIGVVTSKGGTTTTPYVHSMIGPRGAPLSVTIKRDTSKSLNAIREILHRDQVPIKFTMRNLWGEIAAL
jgi:HD-GYP domain-containing protein (c-di-GMP phosphodiesterase class II)